MNYSTQKPATILPRVIDTARRLLARGLRQTEVARQLGVSPRTVFRITRGELEATAEDLRRCPGCGGLIKPGVCVLCTAQAFRQDEFARIMAQRKEHAMR